MQTGWIAPEDRSKEEQERHEAIVGEMPAFLIVGNTEDQPKELFLWDFVKAVYGKHLPNYAQQIGDCVSFGMKNAAEYLQCMEINRLGEFEEFHPIYPPYIYGISRVQIGGGRISGDGSVGSWAADGVRKYGVLRSTESGVPAYSGSVAKEWGRKGPPADMIEKAKPHCMKTTAPVRNFVAVRDAITNGYPVTVASNVGFEGGEYTKDGKKFLKRGGSWGHQMCFVGVTESAAYCLNSWGENFGPKGLNDEPPGGFWVAAEDVDRMTGQDDSYAISQFDGFPRQSLNHMPM